MEKLSRTETFLQVENGTLGDINEVSDSRGDATNESN
jgi:hypothetical protein